MTPATAQVLCRLSLRGLSVRAIAQRTCIPKSTVYDCLKKNLREKRSLRQGSFLILDEHLQRGSLNQKQRLEVEAWLEKNQGRILEVDSQSNTRLLTVKRERALTRRECGWKSDWRENVCLPKGCDDAA